MRVLRVIYDLQTGGVQRMLLRILPLLRQHGVEVEVCCLREEGDLAAEFRRQGFAVHLLPFRSRMDPIGLWRLRGLIRGGRFDLVHAHMYASNIAVNASRLLGAGVPVINSYHSQTPWSGRHQEVMTRHTQFCVSAYVAISETVAGALHAIGLEEDRVHTIPNGVEVPPSPDPLAPRSERDPLRLCWAGRFVRQKRADMVVEIARACRDAGVPATFTMVGDGPQHDRVIAHARELKLESQIRFVGWQKDIRPFLRDADVYISTSNREGLPNTLLEACAAARGFLVADIPPNREVLSESGAGECLGDSPSAWVDAIRRLQADPMLVQDRSLRAHARARDFSVQRTLELTLRLYKDLVPGADR